jgi:hypothetical protein
MGIILNFIPMLKVFMVDVLRLAVDVGDGFKTKKIFFIIFIEF